MISTNICDRIKLEMELSEGIVLLTLENKGDPRGGSWNLPERSSEFLRNIEDLHFSIIRPHCIRGNHFHNTRKEVILVYCTESMTIGWDEGNDTKQNSLKIYNEGMYCIEVCPGISHAIRNDGQRDIVICSLSNGHFDPLNEKDTQDRIVISS